MKNALISAVLFLLAFTAQSQINAITDTGDEVLLFEDGTWKYVDDDGIEVPTEIPVNEYKYTKPEDASFLVKSKRIDSGIWINPKKWRFTKSQEGDVAEFDFELKGEDLYAMLISEKIEIPLESLREIAVSNAQDVAPDIKVVKEEYRNVNGLEVLMIQMVGTIQGIKFKYAGYYYSSKSGTMQLLTYTSENLFDEYFTEIEDFLNGFVSLEEDSK